MDNKNKKTSDNRFNFAFANKKTEEINTLRLIKSAIKDKEIAFRSSNNKDSIEDGDILSLLQNLIKQRKDSIESFKLAKREDLIKIEQSEIEIISTFLPEQMNESEIEDLIVKIINDNKFESLKEMGKLMNILKSEHSGNIDMAIAGKLAKSKLSS